METYRTEEEQLEAIKHWWDQYGTTILLVATLALASFGGWRLWNNHMMAEGVNAGALYVELTTAVETESENKAQTVQHLAQQLKEEYPDTPYANFAAWMEAKQAVNDGDLDKAAETLRWVLEQKPEEAVELLTRLRLARVYLAQGFFDEAMQLLDVKDAKGWVSSFEEVKGDIWLARGDTQQARQAYQTAMAEVEGQRRPVLQYKLDDLAIAPL